MLRRVSMRPLVLSGFMAAGKSTVGRLVAGRAGVECVDLDAVIEARAGASVSGLFAEVGEAGFRRLEAEALDAELSRGRAGVIAVGGGALLDRERRLAVLERAIVVTLRARPEELARRALAQGGRPLLEGLGGPALVQRVRSLLGARAEAYAECHASVDTDGLDAEEIAREVEGVWRRAPIAVAAGARSYAVEIGSGIAGGRVAELVGRPSRVLVVTDDRVGPLHAREMERALAAVAPTGLVTLPAGEVHKDLGSVRRVLEAALGAECDRASVFVGVGGGVVTDVCGFAAACFFRGVEWVAVPTTLLAMVDAAVGGKTGVDVGRAKNAAGAFHQPRAVACDLALAATEPQRGHVSALAEVAKAGLVGDAELFELLEREPGKVLGRDPGLVEECVRRSVAVKASVVGRDEREGGLRAVLNLGHTMGHALEAAGGFERWTHGEAVALGLVAAVRFGVARGLTPVVVADRVVAALAALGLPVTVEGGAVRAAADQVGADKKRAGADVRMVFVRGVGEVSVERVPLEELRGWMRAGGAA
ncbi:MAG: 3-dehydroquinate synthase [Polyangiaceae bacterium]|nr:3-dehydroquinate synthase [Polyangiaceae bacterium]